MKLLRVDIKRQKLEALKPTRAEEFLGLGAFHGPLLLKVQHRRSEDPLDLLRDVPPGLVVLGFGCAARLHLRGMEKGLCETVDTIAGCFSSRKLVGVKASATLA